MMFWRSWVVMEENHPTQLYPLSTWRWAGLVAVHGQDAKEIRTAPKNLQNLRAAICLAQEMGKGLGRGALLFGQMQDGASSQLKIRHRILADLLPIGNFHTTS
jgi:hypothetical protein